MTYQSGTDVIVRGNFLNNGVLPNTQDTNYRAISDSWPVFAFGTSLAIEGIRHLTNDVSSKLSWERW
jgi:hypothetical protein